MAKPSQLGFFSIEPSIIGSPGNIQCRILVCSTSPQTSPISSTSNLTYSSPPTSSITRVRCCGHRRVVRSIRVSAFFVYHWDFQTIAITTWWSASPFDYCSFRPLCLPVLDVPCPVWSMGWHLEINLDTLVGDSWNNRPYHATACNIHDE